MSASIFASRDPHVIHTLLGSCVAVCLHDPLRRVGGMNHILMPGKADMARYDSAARYGVNAMELLINRMMVMGADRRRMLAKVFGGGHVLPAITRENGMGRRNVEFVFAFLADEKIPVAAKKVGGTQAQKIYFHTDSGDVFVKGFSTTRLLWLARQERGDLKRVKKSADRPAEIIWY